MSHQTVFIMKFSQGKALSPFPDFMSKDIDKTILTVVSVHSPKHFSQPIYFHLNVSLCKSHHENSELQNICRVAYFGTSLYSDYVQPISLFINNISRTLNITAKYSNGDIVHEFNGEICVQIEGCSDTF